VGRNRNKKKNYLTKANAGRKRGTTAYLSRRRHKNRLESLSTTAAPPSEGRKPCRVACSSPSFSSAAFLHYSAK